MAEFPRINGFFDNIQITPFSPTSLGSNMLDGNATASAVYPSANRAILVPFRIGAPMVVTQMFCLNGTVVSGNVDVGIYDLTGTRLVSIGTTAQAGTSAIQTFNITDTYLSPAAYYMAIALDNTTGTFIRQASTLLWVRAMGCAQVATSFVLPATLTPAVVASAYIPYFGLSGRGII